MTWPCSKCDYTSNEDGADTCVACGTLHTNTSSMRTLSSVSTSASHAESDAATTIIIELPAKQKLGVKLMPPKTGVIEHGLSIDNIDNPLLDAKVAPGDLIVAIGGTDVDGLGFSEAIELIRKMPRPLAITFEIVLSRRENAHKKKQRDELDSTLGETELPTYAVVFEEGPMGLNLEEATRYGIDGAVVKAVKGQAKSNGLISIGDIVCKVNETDVLCMHYNEVMNVIRKTPPPRTLQFVPKDKLPDVQRVNSRNSEAALKPRPSEMPMSKFAQSSRIVKAEDDENKSIQELIRENKTATIKKGRMYKQSRVLKQWKARYFVLSVSKLEYFKSPSSTSSRGELEFLHHRCTVRSLPSSSDMVSKAPAIPASFLLEVRADEKRLVMACASESEKKAWMDALKLAIDASRTIFASRTAFTSGDGTGRLSQFDYDSFPTPVLHVSVVSATNLAKPGSTVNAMCEITLNAETFTTMVIKGQRSPEWRQDNTVTFEATSDESVLEIRVYDEHGFFKSSELLSTLQVPLKTLPNMEKTFKEYPLVLGSRTSGAVLTLAFEYVNKAKEYQERVRGSRRNTLLNDREEMLKIKSDAQHAADEAEKRARRAEEEAKAYLNEAQLKAERAMEAARAEREEGKAAVEAAMAEAEMAKQFAEKQAAEAKRAQEEAQALIEANRRIQEQSNDLPGMQYSEAFMQYRKMLLDGKKEEVVRDVMKKDGVEDRSIDAFFSEMKALDLKIKELQAEVEKLKSGRGGPAKDEPKSFDMSNISSDQALLLRRLLKLEKQLQQAGIAIADDIPYEEAKVKVETISRRMGEIGSADVTHPDPKVQKQLREEYYKLEQDMEKYNTALMLTDEYAAEQARKEREWEEENAEANALAVKAIRRMMPVDVASRSEAQLQEEPSPNGKRLTREVALKFKRTNVLQILRTSPQDLAKAHPSVLENLRVTGLTVTERRAVHMHLRDVAAGWEGQKGEEMAARRYAFFKTLKETFKTVVNSYNRHVAQYGPPGNHPYATRDNPDIGCPLLGKQCPLKADAAPAYIHDLGYPVEDVYIESTVQKSSADDAGAQALAEAKRLVQEKTANARAEGLKQHYKNKIRLVADANGACEKLDAEIDHMETQQAHWIKTRLSHDKSNTTSPTTIKVELADFMTLVNQVRLSSVYFAERSGMNLTGKRDPANDTADTRSAIECGLAVVFCDAVVDCFAGIEHRLEKLKIQEKRLQSTVPATRELVAELKERSTTAMAKLPSMKVATRRLKPRADIEKEIKEQLASEGGGSTAAAPAAEPERPPNPMMAALSGGRGGGRGRGRGRGGNPLMAAIAGRGKKGDDDDDAPPARPNPFGGGRGGGNPLMAAIQARAKKGDDDDDAPAGGGGRGDFLSAIRGRGGGRGRGGMPGRGDFLSAIKNRKNDEDDD
ncbi:hypothetical protein SDRG_02289 [Saprolegnia diclina VS20]|uniref:PH domain-containing protein n=1 Tax=Saprolegnia diclina (strain VS20) TaxID=1156394 RepID=T0SC61_SAPDV|nr:hypothetical protein SDRG_02289 [Saprolegnia diclina VS20]EQC40392.1 hypothetical protein SDRG_02289 [Saprolegnia diclina VS20]|eukprot:XP_008606091.1 hypothetical protein SDRG_02289 [Saprolegnia diclina VS20]